MIAAEWQAYEAARQKLAPNLSLSVPAALSHRRPGSRLSQPKAMIMTDKPLYTAKVRTTGGREHGTARSADGYLEVRLSTPGSGQPGTNPEQLLAAGWSACFESALGLAARKRRLRLPVDPVVDAEIDLLVGDNGYFLRARLDVAIPGVEREVAEALLGEAEATCPYSKSLRNTVATTITLRAEP